MTTDTTEPASPAIRPPRRGLRRLLRVACWGLAVAAVTLFTLWRALESDWARERVRTIAVRELGEALQRDVVIGALDFDLLPPSLVASGIVVAGPSGLEEPLASIGSVSVRAGTGLLRSLLGDRPIELAEILVVEPRVTLIFYEDGSSNLPDLPAEQAQDEAGLEVRIGSLHVRGGRFDVEELSVPLEFAAKSVTASLIESGSGAWIGRLDSGQLILELPEMEPLDGTLSLQMLVSDGRLDLQHGSLHGPHFSAELDGGYHDGTLRLHAAIEGEGALLESLGLTDQIQGAFGIDVEVESSAGEWSLTSVLTSSEIMLADQAIRDVEVVVGGTPERIHAELAAAFSGGRIAGVVEVPLGEDRADVDLRLDLSDLDLAAILESVDAPVAGLAGRLSASLDYSFAVDAPQEGRGGGEVRVVPPSESVDGDSAWQLPLSGTLSIALAEGVVQIEEGLLQAPGQRLSLSGEVALEGPAAAFEIHLETEDPRAALRILPAVYENDDSPLWEPSRGRGTVRGTFTVDPMGFRTDLELAFEAAEISGSEVPKVVGTLAIDGGGIQNLRLDLARGTSTIALTAAFPFDDPEPGFDPPAFGVTLEIDDWILDDAGPWLPLELPFSGRGTGRLELWGTVASPSGRLDLSVLELSVEGLEIEGELSGGLRFNPEIVDIGPLRFAGRAGDLEIAGTFELAGEVLDLRLTSSPLEIAALPFDDVMAGYLAGVAEVQAELTGTLDSPVLDARLTGSGLALAEHSLGDDGASELTLAWSDGEVEVAGSLFGLLTASGGGRLATVGDSLEADLTIGIETDQLEPLLELATGEARDDLVGRLSGALEIEGGETLTVLLRLDELELTHLESRLVAAEPVQISLRDGGLYVDSFYLVEEGTGSDLVIVGSLGSLDSGMDLRIDSTVDAGWLGHLFLPDLEIRGELQMLASVRGAPGEMEIDGTAKLVDGQVIIAGFPHAIEDIQGFLFFYPDRVVLDSGSAVLGGGKLSVEGAFVAESDSTWGYELRFQGEDLDLRYPEDWRIRGNVELTLASTPRGRVLGGTVDLERASFVKDFKLGFSGLLRTMFQRSPQLVEETDELLVGTRLNIAVRGPDALHIQTNVAEMRGDLDFTVRGNLADPVMLGTVSLARGGKVELAGTEYEIERGVLTFANPFRNDPQVDLVASSRVKQFEIRLNVFGPFEDLETSISSSPPLADLDIVSLLATGSADLMGELGSGSVTGEGSASAEAFLASQAASLAGRRVGTLLGFDQVKISPLTGSSTDLSAARLTVGKRISRDVFVTYSSDPAESDEEIYELTWQIYPSIALILTRNGKGSFAMDVRWNTTF